MDQTMKPLIVEDGVFRLLAIWYKLLEYLILCDDLFSVPIL